MVNGKPERKVMIKLVCSTCKNFREVDPNWALFETESFTEAFEHLMTTADETGRHNIMVEYEEFE